MEEAVKKAGQEWNSTYADKLEKLLAKRAITVNLGFSTKNLNNLDDVKRRLAELKIEPLTPENKTAIRDLVRELKELARIMEKIQKFKGIELPELQMAKAAKLRKDVAQADEKLRLSQERVRQSEERLILSQQRAAQQADRTSKAYGTQSGYLERLIKRMAIYASFSYAGNFLTSVREVTAQFELQRVSLGAIIQDQTRANALFSEIKAFALKSPVSILDLTKYTKQLAAYKVGWDGVKTDTKELFDWTKKLTDVSVGLGVSMDRVVLAFGQVRATGYLRASEIRQFTEMGVPIVEELAAKLSKMNGELVTAAEVMDLVSKRGISFEMVKDVFNDMTSAGGIFYNMQEKQGNTLYGMWVKLGDAASVMYDEIGNTESVNKGMKAAIQALTDLMRNWQQIPRMMAFAGAATLVFITRQKILKLETAKVAAIQETYNVRMARTNMLLSSSSRLTRAHGFALGVQARMLKMASTAAAAFGNSLTAIKSAIISTGWWALIMALGYVADKLLFTKTNAEKAAEAISKISEETATETAKSVRNFEYLANKAVNAPKGSTEQKEALEELERTYNNILPKELLELEYLEKLNGKYGSLTKTIREYIAEQQRRKAIEEIGNVYGAEKQKYERKLTEYFRGQGWTEGEIARFWEKFYGVAKDKSKSLQRVVAESVESAGREGVADVIKLLQHQGSPTKGLDKKSYDKLGITAIGGIDYIDMLRDAVLKENQAIEQNEERTKAAADTTNAFAEAQEKAAKRLKEVRFVTSKGESIDRESYIGGQMLANFEIKDMTNILKDGFAQAGLTWDAEYGNFINHINDKTPELISSLNFEAIINAIIDALDNDQLTDAQRQFLENLLSVAQQSKKRYEEIVPADPIVRVAQTRFKQIAQSAGGFREQYNQYLMKAGEDMKSYNKRLKDEVGNLKDRVKALLNTQKLVVKAGIFAKWQYGFTAEEIQKEIDDANQTIAIIEKAISEQPDYGKNKGGTKSDPRLQNLKEEISLVQKLYNEYKQLEKQEGATKAAADMRKMAGGTLDMFKEKYNIDLPTDAKDLTAALEILYAKMAQLPKKVFPALDKDLKELRWTIEKVNIDESQKNIEAQLKLLSDRISHTKTAKEFYEKILEQTGDINIATRVSMSIYGSTGEELFNDTVEQIREAFKTGSEEHPIDLDISAAIDLENQRIDYKKLADIYDKYQDDIIEKRRETAKKIATEGQKEIATDILNWRKSLAKAKSYEQKRTDIINTATAERAKIIRETTDPKERGELLGLSYSKQAQELAKLAVDEFKSSDDYIKVFQDLDRVSTQTLDRMKKRLEEMIATVKDTENVEGLKTLVEQLDKIKEERETRNPIEGIIDSFKEYAKARKDYRTAEAEEAAAKAEFAQQEVGLNQAIQTAKAEQAIAQQRVNDLKAQGKENTSEGVAAELVLNEATKKVAQATENRNKAVKKVNNAEQKTTDALDAQKAALAKLQKNVNAMANAFSSAASSIKTIADMMGIAEDSELGDIVNGLVDGLNNAATIMTTILAIAIAIEAACWWMLAIGAAVAAFSAIGSWLTGSKVRKANKEIERQQKLLDQLEYTYGRLEKAAEKAFGSDYISNFRQQQKNLQAQVEAYRKQAEAERSKGKKEDKEKTKEYENQARDTAEKIKELQDDLMAHFTGSTRTDVARQMARSWIDARASMSDTFAAIKGDYQDLIKNMLVEGAAARVIENALTPVWNSMQKMLDKNDVQGAIDSLVNEMDSALTQANNGMEVLWKALETRGYDMKKLLGDTDSKYTGIAKSVAGATSEEINNVAAIGNTLMYYVSPIPRIDENLARVVAIMEGRGASLPTASGGTTGTVDYTEMFNTANQHLSSLPRMEQHLAEIHTMLGRALRTKGSTTGFTTFLNS